MLMALAQLLGVAVVTLALIGIWCDIVETFLCG
jgi:hypothetical protein